MRIQAVLFDMDGLLFDTERLALEGWIQAGKELGYPITLENTHGTRGVTMEAGKLVFKKLFGEDFDFDTARAIRNEYVLNRVEAEGIPIKPGAERLLRYLRENGYLTALATSSSRQTAQKYLRLSGFEPCFDHLICGIEVVKSKPDPEIFTKAAAALGVPTENCIVLEDSHYGILAGQLAGCNVIAVPDLTRAPESVLALCYAVCDSLEEVPALLEQAKNS